MADYTQILTETRDDVLLITYNRPDRLNAWTRTMGNELDRAITSGNEDPAIGAIVVTGAGRGFCAGADIGAEFQAQLDGDVPNEHEEPVERPAQNWVDLIRSSKPIIAAVNGPAIGMGLSMILSFDRIMAGTSARLSARFVKVGVVPELASSRYLPQRVGFGAASDLMLSGRIVESDEALTLGLVDEVVPDDELVDAAIARARTYGENAPPHLLWVKELLTQNTGETDNTIVQRRELDALKQAYETPEHREAVAAFLEKRPANFRS